jgi:hypothetical protein
LVGEFAGRHLVILVGIGRLGEKGRLGGEEDGFGGLAEVGTVRVQFYGF